ncbi:hypothetical protein NUITMVRA1_11240 [Aerococcus viridans]|nr:hypothetical protein NUITMVRA1_11240 [Aerococcus viridans]
MRQNISLFVHIIHDISLGNCFARMKDSMAFWRTQNSVNEIQHEISPTLFIIVIEPFIIEAQKKTTESSPGRLSNLQI